MLDIGVSSLDKPAKKFGGGATSAFTSFSLRNSSPDSYSSGERECSDAELPIEQFSHGADTVHHKTAPISRENKPTKAPQTTTKAVIRFGQKKEELPINSVEIDERRNAKGDTAVSAVSASTKMKSRKKEKVRTEPLPNVRKEKGHCSFFARARCCHERLSTTLCWLKAATCSCAP